MKFPKMRLTLLSNYATFRFSKNAMMRNSKRFKPYREPAVGGSRKGRTSELAFEQRTEREQKNVLFV